MEANNPERATRKCPHCGKWSEWNLQPDDTCTHCGQLLDPQAFESRQRDIELKEEESQRFSIDLIEIDPDEPLYLRGPKYLVRAIQISFVAVVSFIIWLVVAVAS